MTRFHYRCRMCGEIDDSCGISADQSKLVIILGLTLLNAPSKIRGNLTMLNIHNCPDGRLGISDLIGAVTEPEEKP